jgi:hypothetical protein
LTPFGAESSRNGGRLRSGFMPYAVISYVSRSVRAGSRAGIGRGTLEKALRLADIMEADAVAEKWELGK